MAIAFGFVKRHLPTTAHKGQVVRCVSVAWLQVLPLAMDVGRIFTSRGATRVFFKNLSREGAKVVKFVFSYSKLRK